jgi:hypothetical protein
MNLTLEERTKVFDKVCRLVETKHFNPSMNGVDWNALAKNRRDQILASADRRHSRRKFRVSWLSLKLATRASDMPECETSRLGTPSMQPCSASL